ncbi:hypothetical protein [Sorangium sp. So ce426]|uniref:hypothetical protein n=1 Tax=Sorangium sp. So ce426 TaxID=3133312 RepID=UPI003F5C09B1
MRARTTVSARVGLKAAALLALGASVTLLGASCYETPPPDPYYYGCPYECVRTRRNFRGEWLHSNYVWLGKASEAPDCRSLGLFPQEHAGTYADLRDTDRCPECLCEPRPCLPPTSLSVATRAGPSGQACEGTLSWPTFPPPAWDGGCFAPRDSFAIKAQSVLSVEPHEPFRDRDPCRPYLAPKDVEATWGTVAVLCYNDVYGGRCDEPGYVCMPPKPEGFRTCVPIREVSDDPSAACPPEFPERLELYEGLDGCSCDCDEVKPRECKMTVSLYADKSCTEHVITRTLPVSSGACVETPGEAPTRGLSVELTKEELATCAPVSGTAQPGVPLRGEGRRVHCCEPAPGG